MKGISISKEIKKEVRGEGRKEISTLSKVRMYERKERSKRVRR